MTLVSSKRTVTALTVFLRKVGTVGNLLLKTGLTFGRLYLLNASNESFRYVMYSVMDPFG